MSFISAVAQCWGERKRQQRTQQKTTTTGTQPVNDAASRSTILTMPRDNAGETQALIDIVMNINGYTLNDMIPNMNELIRNQLTARDKVIGQQQWCEGGIPFLAMHFFVQFLQLSALYSMKVLQKQWVYLSAFYQPLGGPFYPYLSWAWFPSLFLSPSSSSSIVRCLEKTKLRCLVSSISLGLPATTKSGLGRLLANVSIHVQGMFITDNLTTGNFLDHTVRIYENGSDQNHLLFGNSFPGFSVSTLNSRLHWAKDEISKIYRYVLQRSVDSQWRDIVFLFSSGYHDACIG